MASFGVGEKWGELVEMGALHMSKIKDHALKLKRIFDRVSALIETHAPDDLAVEAPFFGKNVQSMLKLGRAQGVALAAALAHEIPVAEYAPRRVKQAVTGSGAASKEQVAGMVQRTLKIRTEDMPKIWTPRMAWRWPCATIISWLRQNAAWRRGLEGVFGGQSGPDSQIIALFQELSH